MAIILDIIKLIKEMMGYWAFDRDSQMSKPGITVNDCIFAYNTANNGCDAMGL